MVVLFLKRMASLSKPSQLCELHVKGHEWWLLVQKTCCTETACAARHMLAYLLLATRHHIVLCILWVCLHLNALLAARGCHGKGPYFGAVVHANLLLLSVKSHSLANQMPTAFAPNIERHLKPSSQEQKSVSDMAPPDSSTVRIRCMIATRPACLITKMPWSIFLARSLKGCWPCCLFMLPFLGSHSGGK